MERTRTRRRRSTPTAAEQASPTPGSLQGKELSYNNLVDLDACWELVSEFDEPARRRSSSTPIRAGLRPERPLLEAYRRALEADPVSAFGGVIGINREVDAAAAEEIAKLFVEASWRQRLPGSPGALRSEEESSADGDLAGGYTTCVQAGFGRHAGAGCGPAAH